LADATRPAVPASLTKCGSCGAEAMELGLVGKSLEPVSSPQGDPCGAVLCLRCGHPLVVDVHSMMRSLHKIADV